MTETVQCTYTGRLRSGRQALPTRSVPYVRGVPVEFTVDEAALLDGDWSKPAADPFAGLDKEALLALAAERGVTVSVRWGVKRLRSALAAAAAVEISAGAAGTNPTTNPSGDAGTTTEA